MDGLLILLNNIGVFIVANPILGYLLLGFAFLLRGEVVVLVSTYLTMTGFLLWYVALPVILISMFVNDYLLYFLGKWMHNTNFGNNIKNNYDFPERVEKYFLQNFIKFMFLVRFAIGLTSIVMFLSGWTKINIKRFFKIHLISSVFWISVYISIGYFLISWFGYLRASEMINGLEVAFLAVILIIILFEYCLKIMLKKASGIKSLHPVRDIFRSRIRKNDE